MGPTGRHATGEDARETSAAPPCEGRVPWEAYASMSRDPEVEARYHELCAYTLSLRDAAFVHQHVVDAHAVQTADEHTKPIAVLFGLVGLHLHVDRGWDGRRVQGAHQRLAARRREWPRFTLPASRTSITAADALAAAPGEERLAAIDAWCAAVWRDWSASHARIREYVETELETREGRSR